MRARAPRVFPLSRLRALLVLLVSPLLLAGAGAAAGPTPPNTATNTDTARVGQLLRQSEQLAGAGHFQRAHAPLAAALRQARATRRGALIGRVLFARYFLAHREGQFEAAIGYGQRAWALVRSTTDYATQARILLGLATTYGVSQDVVSATRYFRQALALAQMRHLPEAEAQAFAGLGITAAIAHNNPLTLRCNERALAIYRRLGAAALYHHVLINQAICYRELARYAESERAFRAIIRYAGQHHDAVGLVYARVNFSATLLRMNQLPAAEQMARLALRAARTSPNRVYLQRGIYGTLAEIMERQGDYRRALRYQREAAAYADTLTNQERAKELVATETRYRTAEKQRQIAGLRAANERQQRRFWWLLTGTLGLAGLMAVAAGQYRIIRQKNQQLLLTTRLIAERNQRITEQAGKLTLLMRELHHRVKNNLAIVASLLRLQANRLPDAQAARAVRESQQRVEAMALIHQNLYLNDDATVIDMPRYVHQLVDSLVRAYGYSGSTLHLAVEVEVEPLKLDVDLAMPLGLIINELVTNAFKHALPQAAAPALRITLRNLAPPDALELEVEDNGPGLATGQRGAQSLGFGNRLVEALTLQLKGQLTVANRPGAYYHLRIGKSVTAETT